MREFAEAMAPHAASGVYVNFLGDEGEDRVRAACAPTTHARLVEMKTKYDPENAFRLNQDIGPRR